jgi:diacylglycerol kinase family enzyme
MAAADPAGSAPGPAGLFVNEGAGSAHSARVRSAVSLTRRALDADLHVTATRDRDELAAFLAERIGEYRTVVIAGGDGSLGVAYNVVAGRDLTLGYIPAGFGNATAHLLDLPRHPAALAGLLATGDARPIDLVEVGGRLALFAGAGWDALVAGRYASGGAKMVRGWAGSVVRSLPDLSRRWAARITADGTTTHEGPMILAVVSVTPFYGRGLRVNPGARPDQGRMTLRTYAGPTPSQAAEAMRWIARRPPSAPSVHAREVVLTSLDDRPIPVQADGDLVGEALEWGFTVRPAAVRLIGRW